MDDFEKAGVLGVVFSIVVMLILFSLTMYSMAEQDEISIFGKDFVRVDAEQEVEEFGCLTSLDLNRDDLRDVVILSNPCNQFGLTSNLYLQQDEQGNQFGIPVCILGVDS